MVSLRTNRNTKSCCVGMYVCVVYDTHIQKNIELKSVRRASRRTAFMMFIAPILLRAILYSC